MENADALFVDLNVHIAYGLQLARRVFYCVTTTRTGNFGDIEDTFSPNRITCFFSELIFLLLIQCCLQNVPCDSLSRASH